jgi:PAS domain S-box-containing protein
MALDAVDSVPPAAPATRRTAPTARRAALWSGLAVAVLVVLATAALAIAQWREVVHLANVQNELLGRMLADSATRNIETTSLALATLGDSLTRGADADAVEVRRALAQTLVNLPFLRGIAVVDAQGLVLASPDALDQGQVIDAAQLGPLPAPGAERLGRFRAGRRLVDLAAPAGAATAPAGVGFVPLVRGLSVDSGRRAYLVAMLDVDAVANFKQVAATDERHAAALSTYDGALVSATPGVPRAAGDELRALPAWTEFLPAREFGVWRGDGLRPGVQHVAFRVSPSRPLLVMVEMSERDLRAAFVPALWRLLLAGAVGLVVVAAGTSALVRSLGARERARLATEQAQLRVARRERELSVTIRSLQEVVFRTDAAGAVTFVNDRVLAITGSDAAQVAGRPFWSLVDAPQRAALQALFDVAGPAGVRRVQTQLTDPLGRERHVEVAVMPLLLDGEVVGFAGSATEVTDRVLAQERLATQLEFVEAMMAAAPVPMSVKEADSRYVVVNPAWERLTGLPRDEVTGRPAGMGLDAAQQALHGGQDAAVLASGEPVRYEATLRRVDGALRDLVFEKTLLPAGPDHGPRILTVITDVTEFHLAEQAIREGRDAAEEASRAKSEFIANISHELRTPLQSIIGFSELGMLRGRADARISAMFQDVHAAGQRMLSLVNDLLDVSKIESTVGAMHVERTDLRQLVRGVLHELEPLLAKRGLQADAQLGEAPLVVKVDPTRIEQVLRNVLANAIRFSPEGGRIVLSAVVRSDARVAVTVADEGPGIPPAELESIFEAFVQSSRTKDGSGGTGLGLAICRKILDAHGGRIRARNRAAGGSEFEIELPMRLGAETAPMPLEG